MKRTVKKLGSLALALMVAAGALTAMPLTVGAVAPSVTVNTTTIAFAGHEWVVIGDAGSGVATGTDGHVTLLQKNGDLGGSFGNVYFNITTGDNNYTAGELYTAMQGLYGGFGSVEKGLVKPRTLDDVAVDNSGARGTLPDQFVWPLSDNEHTGIGDTTVLSYGSPWWMRSPDPGNSSNAQVGLSGGGLAGGRVNLTQLAVRPAFFLDLNSVIFTSDAAGGKSSVAAGNWSSAGSLQTTDAIKLTLPDSGLSVTSANVTGVSGNTITFEYTAGGTYNRLSAIIQAQDGTVTQYGNLANTAASGTASVTVPGGLSPTGRLLVFVEQVNADADYMSDFASAQVQLTRTAPTGLAGTAPTTHGGADGLITDTTAEMEYSTDGTSWTPCTAPNTTVPSAGTYQVRYIGAVNGIQAIDTAAANVTVGEGVSVPTVGSINAPDPVDAGQQLVLAASTVAWNGETGTEGWQISEDNTNWAAFDPATAMTAAHNGRHLRYFATNSKGTGTSNTVQISINNAPTLAAAANNSVTPPGGALTVGKNFTFSATGDRQNVATGTVVGETRYEPRSWNVNPTGTFPIGGPYTATTSVSSAGSHTLTITYQLQRWNGSAWQDVTGSTDQKSVTLNVQAAASGSDPTTSTPSSTSGSPTSATGAGGSPQTGDTGNMGLWVLLGLSSAALLAGLVLLERRRRMAGK